MSDSINLSVNNPIHILFGAHPNVIITGVESACHMTNAVKCIKCEPLSDFINLFNCDHILLAFENCHNKNFLSSKDSPLT